MMTKVRTVSDGLMVIAINIKWNVDQPPSQYGSMEDVPYLLYGEGVNPNNWVVDEDIDAIDFHDINISPIDIHHVFIPGSWVIVQVMPILHIVITLHYYIPIEFFLLAFGFIITVGILQALLKSQMKFIIQRCISYL